MTKIKLCGISRFEDIAIVNHLKPEYIGFVFAKKSKRYVSSDKAADLKKELLFFSFIPFQRSFSILLCLLIH